MEFECISEEIIIWNSNSVPSIDVDLVNYFDIVALFYNLGYRDFKGMYWMNSAHCKF